MQLGTLVNHLTFGNDAVANAAHRFATIASDEDWLNLMTVMERGDDPVRGALERMLRWSLKRDAAEAEHNAGHAQAGGWTCGGYADGCHSHSD